MDGKENPQKRAVNPRRRKRTRMQNFREAYLPVILIALVLVLVVILVVSTIRNNLQEKENSKASSIAEAASLEANKQQMNDEAARILAEATVLAKGYDYDAAISKLESFNGDIYADDYSQLLSLRDQCVAAKENLVVWEDPSKVPAFSMHMLIADPQRAFTNAEYISVLSTSYITTNEFSAILADLHKNGYVLVDMDDVVTVDSNGYSAGKIYLPEGKKPIMLIESHTNYYTYLTDSNDDGLPDAGGTGFASRMIVDDDGKITCEMVDASGQTVTGAFDVAPILSAFIEAHPDFSYRGARATLAVTGYDGLFGYRTNPKVKETMGEDYYNQQVAGAKAVAAALRAEGYTIACYTYDHCAYGNLSEWELQEDLKFWKDEVEPILGKVDTLVLAKDSDIGASGKYTGQKFALLQEAGFRYYYGFCDGAKSWAVLSSDHVRIGRQLIYAEALQSRPSWYMDFFDNKAILDPARELLKDK